MGTAAALATLLALACRKLPPPEPAPTATSTPTARPDPTPTLTPPPPAPSPSPFPAPTWLADLPPHLAPPVPDGFLLAYTTHHQRVTRDGAPLFTLASLGHPIAHVLELAPVGDAVLVWAHSERRFIALLWSPTGTRTLATSDSAAFALQSDALLHARGPEIVERSITTGVERSRQRFPAGTIIQRLGLVGRDVLVLIDTGPPKQRRQDLHILGRPTPLVRDVHLNAILPDRWSLHTNTRGNFTVGESGTIGPSTHESPRDPCSAALCVRSVRASALIQLGANGQLRRLTRWIADPEQNASDPQPVSRHQLTAIRGVDGTGLRFREAPDLPWRAASEAAAIVAPATPNATQVAIVGERMIVAEEKHLHIFGPGTAERTLDRPNIGGDLIADREYVTIVSTGAERVTLSLDGPAPPAHTTRRLLHPDGPHTLDIKDRQLLVLDGRELPFRPPENMRGDHSPLIDGIFPVPNAPKALLAIGRQSAHGGHYVHDRVLALNLADGQLHRVGPDGARPLGERSQQRFGVWRSLHVDASGRFLLMHAANSIVLAPLDGTDARPLVARSPDDLDPSLSPDRQRWAAIHNKQLIFGDFTGTIARPRTRPLRDAWLTWAPSGRAFITAGPGNNHAVHDDGSVHPLACKGAITRVLEVLPDARAALVDHDGTLHIAAADACLPVNLPHFTLVPRGQRHLERAAP